MSRRFLPSKPVPAILLNKAAFDAYYGSLTSGYACMAPLQCL